jgi:hypothetical protein
MLVSEDDMTSMTFTMGITDVLKGEKIVDAYKLV